MLQSTGANGASVALALALSRFIFLRWTSGGPTRPVFRMMFLDELAPRRAGPSTNNRFCLIDVF